jgi:hypothetical protein
MGAEQPGFGRLGLNIALATPCALYVLLIEPTKTKKSISSKRTLAFGLWLWFLVLTAIAIAIAIAVYSVWVSQDQEALKMKVNHTSFSAFLF